MGKSSNERRRTANAARKDQKAHDSGAPQGEAPGGDAGTIGLSFIGVSYVHVLNPPAPLGASLVVTATLPPRSSKPAAGTEPYEIKIGEIIGYRAWRVTRNKAGELLFHSMHMDEVIWPNRMCSDTTASTDWLGYKIPMTVRSDPDTGVYAWKTRARALSYARPNLGFDVIVVGEVELWGDVVEHEDGYRAQHARIGRFRHIVESELDPLGSLKREHDIIRDMLLQEMKATGTLSTIRSRLVDNISMRHPMELLAMLMFGGCVVMWGLLIFELGRKVLRWLGS